MLGRDLLKLAGDVLELVELGIGVIAWRGGGLGLGIEGVRLGHLFQIIEHLWRAYWRPSPRLVFGSLAKSIRRARQGFCGMSLN